MSVARVLAGGLAVALGLAGCASEGGPPGDAGRIDAELVSEVTEGDERAVAEASNAFGFDLLNTVGVTEGNTVTAPASVSALLAMVLAGAGGETAEAMAGALHLDDSRDVRVGALLHTLADTEDVTLSVANALWARDGAELQPDYTDFVMGAFGATLEEADLGSQATADEIDAWVDERTEGRITEIAEDLQLPNPNAVLVLLNAVYFLGEWTEAFEEANTRDAPFTLTDGTAVDVPLMHAMGWDVALAERDGYRMLRLPYGEEGRFGMEIMLPDEGSSLEELLATVDVNEWSSAVDALTEQNMDEIAIPRFELEWGTLLNDPLIEMGMGIAFDGASDFTPMSPIDPYLAIVFHKTYIRVDEAGTEAAGVTGAVMEESAPVDPQIFRADRPFAFTISDSETGAILFLGTVADPRGDQ